MIASVSVSPAQIDHGQTATFTVSISPGPAAQPVTVSYSMSGNAVLGTDYTLSGMVGQVMIPTGQSSATVILTDIKANNSRRTATMTLTDCGPNCAITPSQSQSAGVILR